MSAEELLSSYFVTDNKVISDSKFKMDLNHCGKNYWLRGRSRKFCGRYFVVDKFRFVSKICSEYNKMHCFNDINHNSDDTNILITFEL